MTTVPGGAYLVAYLVAGTGESLDPAQLRRALAEQLPSHMIPSAFVVLEALPLTPNGKLDRRALPAPEGGGANLAEPPQGPVETAIAAIWTDLLHLEHVGRHDNFFELGGHSLLVITLINRLRELGLRTDMRSVFTDPTLAGMAAAIDGSRAAIAVPPNRIGADCATITPDLLPLITLEQPAIDAIVATVPGGARNVQDIYPLAPLQEGILFHSVMSAEADAYVTPALLAFDRRASLDRFLAALQSVIDRHDILRTAFLWEGLPEPVQVVWRHATMLVEEVWVDEIASEGEDAATAMWRRAGRRDARINIRKAPLLHVMVARDDDRGRWLLVLLNHHLVIDHTTLDAIVAEVHAHFAGRVAQLPTPLPFRTFVAEARTGMRQEEHEAFFRDMLGDIDEPTAPFDLLDVQGDGSSVAQARLAVETGLARRLRTQARRLGASAGQLVPSGLGAGPGPYNGSGGRGVRHRAVRPHDRRRRRRPRPGVVHQHAAAAAVAEWTQRRNGSAGNARAAGAPAAARARLACASPALQRRVVAGASVLGAAELSLHSGRR